MSEVKCISCSDLEELVAELVERGGCLALQATGHSMRPDILDGETVVLGPLPPHLPSLGEVLLARAGSGLVLHRLVGIRRVGRDHQFELRGDAEMGPAQLVPAECALARVVERPRLGPLNRGWRWLRIVFRTIR